MRRCQKVFLTLSIVLLSAFLPAAVANGQGIPSLPNTFYGEVIVNGASPGRDDLTLTAVVDGDKHYSRPIAADGIYGGPRYPAPQLRVGGDVEDVDLDGKLIRFFVTVGAYSPTTNPGVETNEKETFDSLRTQPLELNFNVSLAILTVAKVVVNDDGGTAVAGDFTMTVAVSNANPSSFPGNANGTTVILNLGDYTVSESGPSGYIQSQSGDCTGTLLQGDEKSCVITNDDVSTAVTPTPTPTVPPITTTGGNGNGGGGAGGVAPTATPTPTQTLAPSGPDEPVEPTVEPTVPPTLPSPTATVEPPPPTATSLPPAQVPEEPVVAVVVPDDPVPPPELETPAEVLPPVAPGGFPWWVWPLIALLILAAGGGGFYYWRMRNRLVV